MNQRLERLKGRVRAGEHRSGRQTTPIDILAECEIAGLSWPQRVARLVRRQCETERVVIDPEERIVFTRTLPAVPPVYGPADWERLIAGRTLHELGPISNVCADWSLLLTQGLLGRKQAAWAARDRLAQNPHAVEFLDSAIETIDAVMELVTRYAAEARALGRDDLAEILERVPAQPASTFHEALQSLRICHAVVWLGGNYHVGLGRFDQYMWPYLESDLTSGRISSETAEDLLAEFFISLNKDSDLYPGVQQGDNGQTLTLGGVTAEGAPAVNGLTGMVLRVARDVAMIDPKINLRISADTDLDLLCLATELTRIGLGFPQYSNDDVVVPALLAHGYDIEDARDYVVAACWEFIIPGRGMDVVNIGAVSFPAAVDQAVRGGLAAREDFGRILDRVDLHIHGQVDNLAEAYSRLLLPPAPYYSIFMRGCLEQGRDMSEGLKYNNFGIHGAGSANAADALAAVQRLVYEHDDILPSELLSALDTDFSGHEALHRKLEEQAPKVGNNDPAADALLVALFDDLADACESHEVTPRGGILRSGTGSAMYYLWLATGHPGLREPVVGATADGRRSGEPLSANLAPSPGVSVRGPISTMQTFAKINYRRICNGGPITMELSDSVFQNPDSIRKTAMLVRTFAQLGCQQLQLNSISLDTLLDAKAHPEHHRNLIVRVWGWSGYFCELAPEYQDHIIARHLYEIN